VIPLGDCSAADEARPVLLMSVRQRSCKAWVDCNVYLQILCQLLECVQRLRGPATSALFVVQMGEDEIQQMCHPDPPNGSHRLRSIFIRMFGSSGVLWSTLNSVIEDCDAYIAIFHYIEDHVQRIGATSMPVTMLCLEEVEDAVFAYNSRLNSIEALRAGKDVTGSKDSFQGFDRTFLTFAELHQVRLAADRVRVKVSMLRKAILLEAERMRLDGVVERKRRRGRMCDRTLFVILVSVIMVAACRLWIDSGQPQ
jgi:hypothetical protein